MHLIQINMLKRQPTETCAPMHFNRILLIFGWACGAHGDAILSEH